MIEQQALYLLWLEPCRYYSFKYGPLVVEEDPELSDELMEAWEEYLEMEGQ